MKVAAWSDGHGILPVIHEKVDIVIIAGDLIYIDVQRDNYESKKWLREIFLPYIKKLDCDKVIMTPGNHDYIFQRMQEGEFNEMIKAHGLEDKLIYLEDSSYEYKGLKFYGCPWCTGPMGWAFSPNRIIPDISDKYEAIPVCDILISHQPPNVDKVGCSYPYQPSERNFGSDRLRNAIEKNHIRYNVCGHIHSGIHNGIQYGDCMIYNVSLLDEDYESTYNVTYFEVC